MKEEIEKNEIGRKIETREKQRKKQMKGKRIKNKMYKRVIAKSWRMKQQEKSMIEREKVTGNKGKCQRKMKQERREKEGETN